MKITKQVGSNDCGLYAIAVATLLAHDVDPTTVIFEQNEMRSHLAECFMRQRMKLFPTKKKTRVTNSVLKKVIIFVCPICGMPEGSPDEESKESEMVQCDKCDVWHHSSCVPIYDKDKEWYCQTCMI